MAIGPESRFLSNSKTFHYTCLTLYGPTFKIYILYNYYFSVYILEKVQKIINYKNIVLPYSVHRTVNSIAFHICSSVMHAWYDVGARGPLDSGRRDIESNTGGLTVDADSRFITLHWK